MTRHESEKVRILLIEACREPDIPREELIARSHILGGMSIRSVIARARKSSGRSIQSGVSTTSLYGIPMGLAFIASGVNRERFEISHIPLIIDAYRFRLNREGFADRVRAAGPALVGMTLNHTADRRAALGMCRNIKKVSKDTLIVLGGVEATFSAREIMEDPAVDYIMTGEGDVRFGQLLESLFISMQDPSFIEGLFFKKNGNVVYTGDVNEYVDLSTISPFYNAFFPDEYIDSGILANVQTSRGCPFACSFCSHTAFWGKKMRYRSPASVVDEIAFLARRGAEVVYFTDSTFTMNTDHVVSVLKGLSESEFTPPVLIFETRVDRIDRKVCRLCRKAGVGIVAIGVEGGDESVLSKTGGKGGPKYVEEVFNVHRWLKEEGLEMYASIIVGLPGENAGTIESTKKLVRGLHDEGLFWADIKLAIAFPGSELTMHPEKYGVKLTGAPTYLFYDRPGFVCSVGPGEEDILKMHRELVSINMEHVLKKDYIRSRLDTLEEEFSRMKSRGKGRSGWYD